MTKNNYYREVKEKLNDAIKEMQALDTKRIFNEKEIASGVYSDAHNLELKTENGNIKRHIEEIKIRTENEIENISRSFLDELSVADSIKGDELTDDVKLFNCGVRLTEKDLRGILARNPNNNTMAQIVTRYAKENNVDLDYTYIPADSIVMEAVKSMSYATSVVLKHFNRTSVYDELIGTNSKISLALK